MTSSDEAVIYSPEIMDLCNRYRENNKIPAEYFVNYDVKRGLRNADGTGVMAGLTRICNVHGYLVVDNERQPDVGVLTYRGLSIADLTNACIHENRFGFEEIAWLLLFGKLPNQAQLTKLQRILFENRELPDQFAEDMIMKAPSNNIMNKLARSVLALYSYDDNPDDIALENNIRQSLSLIARLPTIMTYAYQVKRRHYDRESMYFHPLDPTHSTAQSILNAIRPDRKFTDEEAKLLDLCLMVHADHGGGNNSTFAARVLSSTNTDIYSTIAAAIGSLKGPLHGGANLQVRHMMLDVMENVHDYKDADEVQNYLQKILNKEVGDRSGLLYGMGHAVYTLSDPRATILKDRARGLAQKTGYAEKLALYELVEQLAPAAFAATGKAKVLCANVDFYSGLIYEMLHIPEELYTPIFAVSRICGWCAHRMEEMTTGGRIMRPAYKAVNHDHKYVPIAQRE